MGTILFEPEKLNGSFGYSYAIDSTGNGVFDRHIIATMADDVDLVFDTLTKYYFKPGVRFIFEDRGLRPFGDVGIGRIIAIEINGRMVELTEMFSPEVVRNRIPYLHEKLVREGRAR